MRINSFYPFLLVAGAVSLRASQSSPALPEASSTVMAGYGIVQNAAGTYAAGPNNSYPFVTDDSGTATAYLSGFDASPTMSANSSNPVGDQVNSANANGAGVNFTFYGEVLGDGPTATINVEAALAAAASELDSGVSENFGVQGASATLVIGQGDYVVGDADWSLSTYWDGAGPLSLNVDETETVQTWTPFEIQMSVSTGNVNVNQASASIDPLISLTSNDVGDSLIFSPNLLSVPPSGVPDASSTAGILSLGLAALARFRKRRR